MNTAANNKNRTAENGKVIETAGKTFPANFAIELVRAKTGSQPQLLLSENGRQKLIAPQIRRKGRTFVPIRVHSSLWDAMTLATGIIDRGSSAKLLAETQDLFDKFVGTPMSEAAVATAWNATTHFADVLPSPPSLLISGSDMNCAMTLLQLFKCIARHPIIVTDLNQHALRSLTIVQPTLLLNCPVVSAHRRAMYSTTNYRELVMPAGPGGAVNDVVSSKAVYLGVQTPGLFEVGVPLNLEGVRSNRPSLNAATCLRIRNHFQPWWLHHRLKNLATVRRSRYTRNNLASEMSGLATIFRSCTGNSRELEQLWAPVLGMVEQGALAERSWDPQCALVVVVWPRLHRREKEMGVTELTTAINDVLDSRGEIRQYSPVEIGKLLKKLGLPRESRNFGMALVFDRATSRRVHELASKFKIGEKLVGCEDCAELLAGE
jgi:hypothetical protein